MPSGVEHWNRLRDGGTGQSTLIAASMPSGVEHIMLGGCLSGEAALIAASMPSGVEHRNAYTAGFIQAD